jgi:hypothetical protein
MTSDVVTQPFRTKNLITAVVVLSASVFLIHDLSGVHFLTLETARIFAFICDTEHGHALHPDSLGKVLIFLKEPRANWTKFSKVEVNTIADDGPPATSQPSEGTALSPTSLVIENDATWDLSEMGGAKKTFTIRAGAFSRTYSASRLRETVAPILEKCGDGW